jgi:hypothetical protein
VLIVSPQLILAYPGLLFEEEFNYKNFTILSNEPVSIEMTRTLDAADEYDGSPLLGDNKRLGKLRCKKCNEE